jgi:non-heme chloroperoxidase
MNGSADDLAAVIEALDLNDAIRVGHSIGGGEVAAVHRTVRNGAGHEGKPERCSSPIMLKIAASPKGQPNEVFDSLRAGLISDRT